MSQETHDLRFATKITLINVHNGGKLVLHQTRYKETAVKTIVTGLSGESIFYTLQKQSIQIISGRGAVFAAKQTAGGERFDPLPVGPDGQSIAEANATLKLKVTEAPCILICTPDDEPIQPGSKDDLPVVR